MPFIDVIEDPEPESELAEAYQSISGARGRVANILKIHSISPGVMRAHLALYLELMFRPSGLTRAEREILAVAVSVTNGCHY